MSQPLDLVDPASKTDYFAAAQMLSKAAYAGVPETTPVSKSRTGRICSRKPPVPVAFRDVLRTLPVDTTATQNIYDLYYC